MNLYHLLMVYHLQFHFVLLIQIGRLQSRMLINNLMANAESAENYASKNEHRQSTDSVPMGDAVTGSRFETSHRCGGLIGADPKIKEEFSFFAEDDVCPICLEEYDAENPRIITNCRHQFHLSCILEWFERSNNCAVCVQLMEVADMDLFDRTM